MLFETKLCNIAQSKLQLKIFIPQLSKCHALGRLLDSSGPSFRKMRWKASLKANLCSAW